MNVFASVLLEWMNIQGFVVNFMHPESGSGKSTALKLGLNAFGYCEDLLMGAGSTENARPMRMGLTRNLPAGRSALMKSR